MLKRIAAAPGFQLAAGALIASYLRLVHRTNRFVIEPEDAYDHVDANLPVIMAMWHGQHLLTPFIRKPYHRARVLISRHRDGELNAQAAERLGVETIRGSGDMHGRFHQKGGVSAFRAMLDSLEQGINVALTADVPKIARRAGMGIVRLSALSGRPIVPIAIATSRRKELQNWDRTTINLPFGRAAAVVGEWVRVAPDADKEELEAARRAVETSLNAATARAYEIVDRRDG
jgi:lysophospholipid acyltransferase (LPLAT)-like uncharacterized protein